MTAPVPALPDFDPAGVPDAADLNALADNLDHLYSYLHAEFRPEQRPMTLVRVARENAELPTATVQAMTWDVADVNTGGFYTGVGVSHLEVPYDGVYLVGFQMVVGTGTSAPGSMLQAWITGNSEDVNDAFAIGSAAWTDINGVLATAEVAIMAGSRLRFYGRHNQGTTLPIQHEYGITRAWAIWLGPIPDVVETPPAEDPGEDPVEEPPATVVPDTATLIYTGDFNSGDLSGWDTIQNKDINGDPGSWDFDYPLTIVNDGTGHTTAARFEVRPGDEPSFGGERSELIADAVCDVFSGDERWYEFSIKVPSGEGGPTGGGWMIYMQWHTGSGSPLLTVQLSEDDPTRLQFYEDFDSPVTIGDVGDGAWHDVVLHVLFSSSSGTAYQEAWFDGVKTVPKFFRANMSSSSNYLKVGLYRSDESFTSVVLHDGLKVYEA